MSSSLPSSRFPWDLKRVLLTQALSLSLFTSIAATHPSTAQQVLEQPITLQAKGETIKSILGKLENQASTHFLYSRELIGAGRRVSVNAVDKPLSDVLHDMLVPLQIRYELVKDGIILNPVAADGTIRGRVVDAKGAGLPGVTVVLEGTTLGASTDAEGAYTIQNVPPGSYTLITSFVGYNTNRIPVTVTSGQTTTVANATLAENTTLLNEAVVVGYGTQRRQDVTGSVATVTSKDFVRGQVTNPEQLVQGKVAGVQIISSGGAPGSGGVIRIRGGASLTGSNDPLVVIDGVPVDNSALSGSPNALSLVNPNDIETFTVLKDASATAIYGSRASNGVILITTKKGVQGDKLTVSVSSQASVSERARSIQTLSGDEYRDLVNQRGTEAQKALLGTANTDWQDQIFRTAYTFDNNISLTGNFKKIPFRVSYGNLNQQGILKTSDLKRNSASVGLTPMLFDNHLRIDVNVKGSWADNQFATNDAIGNALSFNPTLPVYSGTETYGGYTEILQSNGNPVTIGTRNPLGLLEQRRDRSTVKRSIGNIQFDYKFHFLPDLRANVNLGYDVAEGNGTTFVTPTAAVDFQRPGRNTRYGQTKTNGIAEVYLNYTKDIPSISSHLEVLAGHSYQKFLTRSPNYAGYDASGTTIIDAAAPFPVYNPLALESYYGRLNYNFKERYLLTATMRADGSSRFPEKDRWGYFPAVSVAWRVKQENFLQDSKALSELKFRAGYGVTGQQDLGLDYFGYLSRYLIGQSSAQYQLGNTFYPTWRAEGYIQRTWESTGTYNAGLDYGFLDNRLSGSVDVYLRKTKDLLLFTSPAAGSNLTNQLNANIGSLENRGVEFAINGTPIRGEKFNWDVNFNFTYNKNEITELAVSKGSTQVELQTGAIGGGTGNNIQVQSVGYPAYSYYVYKQVYGPDGKPLEGVYADLNGDGVISPSDRYRYKSGLPRTFMGFSSNLSYNDWSLAFTLRANLDNYIYDNVNANLGTTAGLVNNGYLVNATKDVYNTQFGGYQYFSDYYVKNASFLRMENLTLGYNVGRLWSDASNLRLTLAGQNLFVVSKYKGADPEVVSRDATTNVATFGINNNFYPRPRTVTLGVNLSF
ncbi:SusC/RagA family TonB-linked outer membrane protein [Hymenobacter cavernae]|nr:SusC/RagA family TonB-linked outer membrane protein [Hymenobacter cavernae]